MIMSTKRNSGWTKNMIVDALNARGVRVSKSEITVGCSAKDMENEKNYARQNFIVGVFCVGGFGGIPDAIIFAEHEPYDYEPVIITEIMFRANRVSTLLIDEIANAIY